MPTSPFQCGGNAVTIPVDRTLVLRIDLTTSGQLNIKFGGAAASATAADRVLFPGDMIELTRDQLNGSDSISVINIGSADPKVYWGR